MTSTFPPATAAAPALRSRLSLTVPSLRAEEIAAGTLVSATAVRLRTELDVEPTGALRAAVAAPIGGDRRVTGWRAVLAQIEAGESAVNAGAIDAGVARLQGAVVAARAVRDSLLLTRALVALGSALIHGVRGVDQEGLALLHEAVPLTDGVDDASLGVTAPVASRRGGDTSRARDLAEHAYVLGEQVGDPCWESLALRSLGLVCVDSGDLAQHARRQLPGASSRSAPSGRRVENGGLGQASAIWR